MEKGISLGGVRADYLGELRVLEGWGGRRGWDLARTVNALGFPLPSCP